MELANKFADTDKCETAMKLIAMMKVKNCCGIKGCRKGQPIRQIEDISEGDTVKINPDASSGGCDGLEGKVVRIYNNHDREVMIDVSGYHMAFQMMDHYDIPSFLFCKC